VIGIVYRCIATHLIKRAGFLRKTSQTGAVTLIANNEVHHPRYETLRLREGYDFKSAEYNLTVPGSPT